MAFLSPIWLLALLPWAAVTAWLLRGRRKKVNVPFLELWRADVRGPRPTRSWEKPPLALAAALLAILLALLAAARPAVRAPLRGPAITIIVDRGITMSARSDGELRFDRAARMARQAIIDEIGPSAVNVRFVPALEQERADSSEWIEIVERTPATAVETEALLVGAVAEALRETSGLVVVLSDQALGTDDPRIVRIPPEGDVANVGIVRFAVRDRPARQAMVRVRNQSSIERAVLRILSDDQEQARVELDLPAAGGERDYFVDVPAVGRVVTAELEVNDDFSADNVASLVRERWWPIVQPRSPLPAEVQRMIESYARTRPGTGDSRRVSVTTSFEAADNDPAAILSVGAARDRSNEPAQVTSHPVTSAVEKWPTLAPHTAPEGPGWTPLVTRGGAALLAVRTDPVRQVWVGFHSPEWAASTDFVILWTNIFDWLGEGAEQFTSHPIGALGPEWSTTPPAAEPGLWPGIYRRADGALRAVNAIDVRIPQRAQTDWRSALARAAALTIGEAGAVPLAPALLLLAMLAVCIAAVAWPARAGRRVHP